MIRYFLSINNIDKINLCKTSINIYFYYYLIININHKYFNILKSILYIKNLAISIVTIFIKSIIIPKKNLMIAIPSLRYN